MDSWVYIKIQEHWSFELIYAHFLGFLFFQLNSVLGILERLEYDDPIDYPDLGSLMILFFKSLLLGSSLISNSFDLSGLLASFFFFSYIFFRISGFCTPLKMTYIEINGVQAIRAYVNTL